MKLIADTHTHSIACDHAYSTVTENAKVASEKGIFAIAVTEHCPAMPDSPHIWHFECLGALPRKIHDVVILRGAEVNLLDFEGNLDLPEHILKKLEWVIVSAHGCCIKAGTIEQNNNAWLNVAKNPYVDVIGHCGLLDLPIDYEKVIPEFGKAGKLVEINVGSLYRGGQVYENNVKIAQLCAKHNVRVVVNSDSHYCGNLGNFEIALKLLSDINFPEELVINADVKRFTDYLVSRHGDIFGFGNLT